VANPVSLPFLDRRRSDMNLPDALARHPLILTEGSLIERLRRDPDVRLDSPVANAALLADPTGRRRLEALFRGYLDIGAAFGLPMAICAPTWRASPERCRAAGLDLARLNTDAVGFVWNIRRTYAAFADSVAIGGLMGSRGDAYRPQEALTTRDAAEYHRDQAMALAAADVDFILAATLPAVSEAAGMAQALAATGRPYVLSFVVRPNGECLDGTPLEEGLRQVDALANPAPCGCFVNCVHPRVLIEAVDAIERRGGRVADRLIGLQANTSRLNPELLDGRAKLDSAAPEAFAADMLTARDRCRLRVLGGCCGTDDRHIRHIAEAWSNRSSA
jgi:homocysteine S-methyltransferase